MNGFMFSLSDNPISHLLAQAFLIPALARAPSLQSAGPISVIFCSCFIGLLCVFNTTFAQTPVGSISDYVSDSMSAVIVNGEAAVRQTGKGVARKTKTRNDGSFTIGNLDPGEYQVVAHVTGSDPNVVMFDLLH